MVAGVKWHSSTWKTAQQNCPFDVPIYLPIIHSEGMLYLLVKVKGEQIYFVFTPSCKVLRPISM